MTQHGDNEMQISERELIVLTRDLDEIHHATLPAMHEAAAEYSELRHELRADLSEAEADRRNDGPVRRGSSRRGFLIGAGAGVGGLLLAACSKSKSTTTGGTSSTTAAAAGSDRQGQPLHR